MNRNKHKVWKIVGIVVLCLLLAGLGFGIWVSNNYKSILKQRIPVWVKRGTHGVYNVSVEDISINIFTRNVTVEGLKLWPDSARLKSMNEEDVPATTFIISAPSVELEDIRWVDILADKDVVIGRLTINEPDIKIYSTPKPEDSLNKKKTGEQKIDRLYAREIIINDPHLFYQHDDSGGKQQYSLDGGRITLLEWEFSQDTTKVKGSFLFAKKMIVSLDSFAYQKQGGLYRISSSGIDLTTDKNHLAIKNLRIKPALNKADFYSKTGHQQDRFDMRFPSISIAGIQWKALLDSNQLIAKELTLQDAQLEDYFTRLAPPNPESKMGKFPNQLLLKLPLEIDIQEVIASNGSFKYTEVNEKSKRAGDLLFDRIKGRITNVTNMPKRISQNNQCIWALEGYFNGKSPIKATFRFSLTDTAGTFSVDGDIKDLDAPQINEVAKALALTKIDSLHVNKLSLHVEGDQNYARGNITFLYNNLKLSLLDTNDKPRGVELDKKNFLSFVANSFLLYPDNPMEGKEVRSEGDYVKRDPYKSFFNLIWKTIFNSIQKTAIRSDNIQELIEENQRNKGKKKEGFFKRIFGKKDKPE